MKRNLALICFWLLVASELNAQFVPVPSGTTQWISSLIKVDSYIYIANEFNFIAKYDSSCTSQQFINSPAANQVELRIVDSNTFFLFDIIGGTSRIFKTIDGGANWTTCLQIDTLIGNTFQFFDADNGILFCDQQNALVTDDAGVTWSKIYQPSYYPSKSAQYSDSIICVDDIFGIVYYSKDRGQNWQYGAGLPYLTGHHSLQLLNDTTIFSVLGAQFNKQYLSYSTDAGLTWHNKPSPMDNQADVVFKSFNEGYVVGVDSNLGCIFKTTDTGNTWTRYYSPNPTALTRMLFINDSIALVGATNGYLAKWNKNSLALSVISEGIEKKPGISASPNPATAMQTIEINAPINSTVHCTLRDISGKLVMQVFNGTSTSGVVIQKVNLEGLPSGVYMYEVQINGSRSYHKIIKS
jgi:Secretion system C-terminal sorting domain/BNR/Asp-box repeat